jgi:hypothetical protein
MAAQGEKQKDNKITKHILQANKYNTPSILNIKTT